MSPEKLGGLSELSVPALTDFYWIMEQDLCTNYDDVHKSEVDSPRCAQYYYFLEVWLPQTGIDSLN